MKRSKIILSAMILFSIAACSSSDDDVTPPEPEGRLIDRAGRAYFSELFIGTFRSDTQRDDQLNDYNTTSLEDASSDFLSEVSFSLASYDGLRDEGTNGNGCGDNALTNRSDIAVSSPLATNAGRYDAFGQLLLDDQIYIDRNAGSECEVYMAVELTAMGLTNDPSGGDPNNDCGGRKPIVDVIQTYYTVVMKGASTGVDAIDDGIGAPSAELETFPFLAAPVN
jgi:hypothetical protein